jgi:hypothetical protein
MFLRQWSPEQVSNTALKLADEIGASGAPEDRNAYWNFARDVIRSNP